MWEKRIGECGVIMKWGSASLFLDVASKAKSQATPAKGQGI